MEFLTVQQTARLLNVSPITVRRYIASGRLPALATRGVLRVRREELERFTVSETVPHGKPRAPQRRSRRVSDDWLSDFVGMAGTDGEAPTDVSSNKHAYLAEAYADLHER